MSRNKPQSSGGLGRALIKNKSKSRRAGKGDDSWLHSSELEDGYDWGRLNLRSVTEESKLDEFLSTAQLAGTEFTAEKLNIKVIDPGSYSGLPSASERREIEQAQEENRHYLSIPRRPQWDSSMTAQQLDVLERDSFLEWRRNLAMVQEDERLVMTPFERNLEFWRQLWRVIERSDIVVQIVDARNPLLFRCEDLEKYVKELSQEKVNMLLISKADLLTQRQREAWAEYFKGQSSISVAFWSALTEKERLDQEEVDDDVVNDDTSDQLIDQSTDTPDQLIPDSDQLIPDTDHVPIPDSDASIEPGAVHLSKSSDARLLNREELVDLFFSVSPVANGGLTTVGMVGYPNVGKSSTINTLIQGKKVPVSATPGRTKHFQTLYLSDHLLLCDCPGLVYPTFVSTKAEMVCSGVLPIDQLRDHTPPVSLVCEHIPRPLLESTYGIRLPPPSEGEDPDRLPTAHELLTAYGYMRGFMSHHGTPDVARSARYILKDYVNGKLLYCHPPPGLDPREFNTPELAGERGQSPLEAVGDRDTHLGRDTETMGGIQSQVGRSEFDKAYFQQSQVRAITKGQPGRRGVSQVSGSQTQDPSSTSESDTASVAMGEGKPWKKHYNRHKKEKTKRTQNIYTM